MAWLDIITFASYLALTADILFQIRHVHKHRSSHDISIVGLGIRYVAILIILYRFYTLGEWPLLVGQLFLAVFFTLYLALVVAYYKK